MAIKDIESKCWILALFVRDDGERFLLGDGSYEFDQKQLHFVANAMANDVVEVQGNDGYLLAGQVRRPSTQSFDGYVGDSSTSKAMVEERRRTFFAFFRKNHFYKVIYVFPDGSAIQRKRGFLVDAPEVKELWQIYPKYHVALNFEDVNYYYYDENADGEEIYGESATISLNSIAQNGGLIWVDPGTTTITEEGADFTVEGTLAGGTLSSLQLKGDTYQQTYSGKNLYNYEDATNVGSGITVGADGWITVSYDNTNGTTTRYENYFTGVISQLSTSTSYAVVAEIKDVSTSGEVLLYPISGSDQAQFGNTTTVRPSNYPNGGVEIELNTTLTSFASSTSSLRSSVAFRAGAKGTFSFRLSLLADTSVTPETFSYEPYVGGTASPNPDCPQEVQTVTGRQVVEVYGKNLWNKERISWYRNNSGLFTNTDDTSTTRIRTNSFAVSGGKTYTISGIPDGITLISVRAFAREDASQTTNPVLKGNTFTTSDDTRYIHLLFGGTNFSSATNTLMANADIQLELGSTATPYQTHQSYEVNLGKNLVNLQIATASNTKASIAIVDDAINYQFTTITGSGVGIVFDVDIEKGKTYTLKVVLGAGVTSNNIRVSNGDWDTAGSYQAITRVDAFGNGSTFTANNNYNKLRIWINNSNNGGVDTGFLSQIQLELGSTATAYAPYFEPIELCKIGDYQDYLYKDGNDWYLHKETGKVVCDGTETDWSASTDSGLRQFYRSLVDASADDTARRDAKCDKFTRGSGANNFFISGNLLLVFRQPQSQGTLVASTVTEWQTWLANNNASVYYALATPTDMQITNEALVSQLEAVAGAMTYADRTTFTVNGNGNLAAIMSIELQITGGGGVIWDENGAVWEEGKPSYSVITIDSIDNVYPVVTITGRTVNPIITDVTTDTIFRYNGTITASQVLVVDMLNKTATLNGTSVIGNVTGDWLYFAPGNNRMSYTADNADAPDVTIEWQEIVG